MAGSRFPGGEIDDPPCIDPHERARHHHKRVGPRLVHRGKGSFQCLGLTDFIGQQRHVQRPAPSPSSSAPRWLRADPARAEGPRRAKSQGKRFLDQLQVRARHFPARMVGRPGDVAAGACEARDQPATHGVENPDHDDRDGARGLFGRADVPSRENHEEVELHADELSCESRRAIVLVLGVPALEDEILALDVPVLPQPLPQRLPLPVALHRATLRREIRRPKRARGTRCDRPAAAALPQRVSGTRRTPAATMALIVAPILTDIVAISRHIIVIPRAQAAAQANRQRSDIPRKCQCASDTFF